MQRLTKEAASAPISRPPRESPAFAVHDVVEERVRSASISASLARTRT